MELKLSISKEPYYHIISMRYNKWKLSFMQDTKTNKKLKELFEVIDNNIGCIEENMKKKVTESI